MKYSKASPNLDLYQNSRALRLDTGASMESFDTTAAYCSGTVGAFRSGMQMESRRSDLGGLSIAVV